MSLGQFIYTVPVPAFINLAKSLKLSNAYLGLLSVVKASLLSLYIPRRYFYIAFIQP
jgi:hypothetical protein